MSYTTQGVLNRSGEPLMDSSLKSDGLFLLSIATHCVTVDEVLDKARHYGFTWKKPNIMVGDDEDDYLSSGGFGYHIFIFSKE